MATEPNKRGGLQVEYAKSSRSSCKGCSGAIAEGSMRIGKETPSDYHDGWDLSWYHYSCCNKSFGAPSFSKSSEVQDCEYLRWADQLKIKKDLGEKIEDNEDSKRKEKENKALWELKDQIEENVPNKYLKTILEENNMEVKKLLHRD